MIVHRFDQSGVYIGPSRADPSPLEPGKHLIPARCTTVPPPLDVPAGQVPRWNGAVWEIVRMPARDGLEDPMAKLQAFLAANPDAAALMGP